MELSFKCIIFCCLISGPKLTERTGDKTVDTCDTSQPTCSAQIAPYVRMKDLTWPMGDILDTLITSLVIIIYVTNTDMNSNRGMEGRKEENITLKHS